LDENRRNELALSAGKGIVIFCWSDGKERTKWSKILQPVILPIFAGQRPWAQKSLADDKRFWLLLAPQKWLSPCGYEQTGVN
jgi:hypothetical protein